MRPRYLFAALLLVLGIAFIVYWRTRPYSATAEIQIRPAHYNDIPSLGSDGIRRDDAAQMNALIQVLQSQTFLAPLLQDPKLANVWKRIQPDHGSIPTQQEVDRLRAQLEFKPVSGTNILKVTGYSVVPQEAADIANDVVDTCKAERDQYEENRNQNGIASLREQITQQQNVVQGLETEAANKPDDHDTQRRLIQGQSLLDALNVRLKQVLADEQLVESPIRILTRAVPPPD